MRGTGILGLVVFFAGQVFAAKGLNIAEGERFEYPERNFSIVPPTGFEVQDNAGGIFLNMREPHRRGLIYRRNIQVFWSKGFHYIDDAAAQKLAEEIGPKFSKYSPSIKNYQVSKHSIIDIGERRNAILFYNSYTIDKMDMMHIVMLISGSKEHYLLTFTDMLKNYEKNENNDNYGNVWWNCFTSIAVAGKPPYRYRYYVLGGGALAAFLLIGVPFMLLRKRSSGLYYDSFVHAVDHQEEMAEVIDEENDDDDDDGDDDGDDDDDDDDYAV